MIGFTYATCSLKGNKKPVGHNDSTTNSLIGSWKPSGHQKVNPPHLLLWKSKKPEPEGYLDQGTFRVIPGLRDRPVQDPYRCTVGFDTTKSIGDGMT